MTLDDLLRAGAERIETLSVFGPKSGAGEKRFQANLKVHKRAGWRVEVAEDPATALRGVLSEFAKDLPATDPDEDIFG